MKTKLTKPINGNMHTRPAPTRGPGATKMSPRWGLRGDTLVTHVHTQDSIQPQRGVTLVTHLPMHDSIPPTVATFW